MNYGELLAGGVKLMVFGMGMTFTFLIVMIFAMKIMEVVLRPFAKLLDPPKPAAAPAPAQSDDAKLAAIAAAVVARNIGK